MIPRPTNSRLSDSHMVVLAAGAARSDGSILPVPTSLKARGAALTRMLSGMVRAGLIGERPARDCDAIWRIDEADATKLTLVVTGAGLAAMGLDEASNVGSGNAETCAADDGGRLDTATHDQDRHDDGEAGASEAIASGSSAESCEAAAPGSGTVAPSQPRAGSKAAAAIELLERNTGATLSELMTATGWQAHSVRGFMSGMVKRKMGRAVVSAKDDDGTRRYRVTD